MLIAKTLTYYKRRDVQEAIVEHALDKEVAVLFRKGFGKRPEVLQYPTDVLSFAQRGALSFHCSEELWLNPAQLSSDLKQSELEALRKGWDLVLDIDCPVFQYSKIFALHAVKFLQALGVKHLTIKFSGNKGFHIGLAFQAFPKKIQGVETVKLYPELPRKIARFVLDKVKHSVAREILRLEGSVTRIASLTGFKPEEILVKTSNDSLLNIEKFLTIDTLLISSRHLYRMPYSFHEKSGLVSVPIPLKELQSFERQLASPENVQVQEVFINRKTDFEEARFLVLQALDHKPELVQESGQDFQDLAGKTIKTTKTGFEGLKQGLGLKTSSTAIPKQHFPPCIKKGLQGLPDGRKRFLFILINFLRSINYEFSSIESIVWDWNKKNPEPLRESYVKSQLNYAKKHSPVLPPNCDRHDYYKDINICNPDSLCKLIKNPVNYALKSFNAAVRSKSKVKLKNEKSKKRKRVAKK
ncbi:hypothetical protein J7L02_01605 [Candidatus Woesearchaeota archaeon]|nr:hypothetical protein [Candidatus Woesearchaeota archaeon]